MHHATARDAVCRILSGSGFAESAIGLALATRLSDDASCPDDLRHMIIRRCLDWQPDQAAPYTHPLNQQPVPDDGAALAAQLIPALIAHPADAALGASSLWSLVQLWPHCSSDERPLLRTLFLNSIAGHKEVADGVLTTFQLREWQKQVPTHYGTLTPSVVSMRGVLEATDPLAAYLLLAEHLGMQVDLETMCWVLGSLSVQLLQSNHDRQGRLAGLLLGATACEHLVPLVQVEHLVTVISQLNHRIWWLKARGSLHVILRSTDLSQRPLGSAIVTGDITMSQRAGRALASQQPGRFWDECWQSTRELLPTNRIALLRLLTVFDTARWRSEDGIVAVDDASAIAATLTDLAWQRTPRPA